MSRKRDLRFPPLISREKDSGLPPGTSEKAASSSKAWREDLGNILLIGVSAVVVIQLKGQGRDDIQQTIRTYLPEFSTKRSFADEGPVWVRNVMTYHSTLPGSKQ